MFKRILASTALIGCLILPALAADQQTVTACVDSCVNQCDRLGSGEEYQSCLQNCIAQCPTPDVPDPGAPQPVPMD